MILISIAISVTGFFISELAQKLYKHDVEERLKTTAILIESQVSENISIGGNINYNETAKKYAGLLSLTSSSNPANEKIGTRITFIDYKGKVTGESDADYHNMENHLNRKEVIEAVNGKVGRDIRHSKTLNMDFLYIALPLKSQQLVIRVSVPLVQLKSIDKIILYYTIIGIFAGFVLTALLAFKFSSTITKPVNELISTSKEISLGNYSKRVSIQSKDELGQLAHTFNEMALKLEKNVADLTDQNAKFDSIMNSMANGIVAVDKNYKIILINTMACDMFGVKDESDVLGLNIIELIRNSQISIFIKEALEKNTSLVNEISLGHPDDKVLRIYTNPIKPKDAISAHPSDIFGGIVFIQDITNIKKLEQIRTEFVSNVTHELKTPLTSIRGFVETLRNGAISDSNVAEKFLEIIDIEAERLYMLINDILQLSEIETKHSDSNIGTYELYPIVQEVISILQGVADKKGIMLKNDIERNLHITINKDRIKQMLINLIDNGLKYNNENGSVAVKAYKEDGKIIIRVNDTGIGISKEHLPRIFERFYRVDKGRSRNMGGTGLGLSIVKHIVNLYNGDVKVNSQLGTGTEFIIRLPA